jgi:phosphatidylserine decarboxylase
MFVKGTLKKAGLFLTLAVLPFLFGYFIISLILFSILAFIMQFFRDPNRRVPSEKGVVVAPADGRVLKGQIDRIEIVEYNDPLMKHILEKGKKGVRISTFMSPFDVHVNRSPVSGKIVKTKHFSGKFKLAFKNAETETEKEKNLIVIEHLVHRLL